MNEIWKQIDGYNYEVSTFGHVRKMNTEVLLNHYYDQPGEPRKWGTYPRVKIPTSCSTHFHAVHRLVALYHLPRCNDPTTKKYVDHIDRNRLNCHVDNLRWVTPRENSRNLTKRSDNTSGKQGVSRSTVKGRTYWKVSIRDNDGKRKTKNFSVNKLGDDEAKRQAIEYRKQLEQEYDYIGD